MGPNCQTVSAGDLAAHTGADRERVLFESAKREGKVVWYITLAADQNKQIAALFEKKYPGVTVDTYHTGASALAQRLLHRGQSSAPHRRCLEATPPGPMNMHAS
ncbi:MAG TPA: hypothetical protein VGH22_03845 [Candidatus Binatia bacterium]|jgi:iron(III) transport system substrate-binding protein